MNVELKEYRKRISLSTTAAGYSPPPSATQSQSYGTGNDFSFNFPKFGDLPDSFLSNGSITKTTSPPQIGQRSIPASTSPESVRKQSSGTSSIKSPPNLNGMYPTPLGQSRPNQISNNGLNNNNYDGLDGLFGLSVLENAKADYLPYTMSQATSTPSTAKQGSVSSVNGRVQRPALHNASSASINSPSSSMSHGALDSSCGTTPESSADSPDNRKSSEGGSDAVNYEGVAQNKGKELFERSQYPV